MALKSDEPFDQRSGALVRPRFDPAVLLEVTRRNVPSAELDAMEEDEGAVLEIEAVFRRKLMGLRRLPRSERASALRAARDWRQSALKALREKRASERHARHMLRRLCSPAPH